MIFLLMNAVQAQTVWNGPTITFTKSTAGDGDPTLPENQDRITPTTWITRGTSQGLFNAYAEESYDGSGPSNTEWATGELDDYASLTYHTWVEWAKDELGGPPHTVGVAAVLHLIAEDIYIGIKFKSWDSQGENYGSFSYQRTTSGEPVLVTYYRDSDGDGYGDLSQSTTAPSPPAGYVEDSTDCNDADNTVYPGAPEIADGKDNNCNGETDETVTTTTWYRDFDQDSFGDPARSVTSTTQPVGYVSNKLDCNDYRVFYEDVDNDGWGNSTKVPCGLITRTGDCDDNNNKVHSPQTFYRDADGDSWGDAGNTTVVCSSVPPAGYVANKLDCNDGDKMIRYCPPTVTTEINSPEVRSQDKNNAIAFVLSVYPNPVQKSARIVYTVPMAAQVSIKLYDVLGREVNTVFSGQRNAGTYTAEYNGQKLSQGVYYCRMTARTSGKDYLQTVKLVKTQ